MTQELQRYVTEKTHELMAAPSCCAEIKLAAQQWLDAVGTASEASQTAQYVKDLESVLMPIDGLIGFAGSDAGARCFGDAAQGILAHAQEIKAAGGKYCDCPACTAVAAILEKKAELL